MWHQTVATHLLIRVFVPKCHAHLLYCTVCWFGGIKQKNKRNADNFNTNAIQHSVASSFIVQHDGWYLVAFVPLSIRGIKEERLWKRNELKKTYKRWWENERTRKKMHPVTLKRWTCRTSAFATLMNSSRLQCSMCSVFLFFVRLFCTLVLVVTQPCFAYSDVPYQRL